MTIDQFIEVHREDIIKDISSLIEIPTVFDPDTAKEGQPFGEAVNRGLLWILTRAEEMGMKVRNLNGYAGEITAGDGSFMIGILVHEDVVPAGDGWETEPFQAVLRDGKLFGRGSSDDKGPLVSSLYAMKYLMEENMIPDEACLRMIVGTNEEESWKGIEYYKAHVNRLPDYSIVPDGYFPLIYCEKGLLDIDLYAETVSNADADILVTSLEGGSSRNVVAGSCSAELVCKGFSAEETVKLLNRHSGITACARGKEVRVKAEGKSTHAMSPEKGSNAVGIIFAALHSLPCTLSIGDFVEIYCRTIGMTYHGEKLGIDFEDELTGKLTFNIGVIRYNGKDVELEANLRYPASMKKEEIWQALQDSCSAAGFICTEKEYLPPVYIKPDSPFVKRLMNVYRKISGDTESRAFTIGGATYARAIPEAVAFGPLFPYEEELAHEANEFISIESLDKMTAIFAEGLRSLLELKP